MQLWEYKVERAQIAMSGQKLDPDVTDWDDRFTREPWGKWAAVLWSDRGYFTTHQKCLDELGAQGWELVGTTPPWIANSAAAFYFIFKRSKE